MDLSYVRHGRIAPRQVAMTDERPGMSIALDADVIEENQAFASRLAEAMLAVAGEACNPCYRRGLEIGSVVSHTLVSTGPSAGGSAINDGLPKAMRNESVAGLHIDHDGEEFADKFAAWAEATRMAGEIIKDIDGRLRPGHDWKLEVEDEFKNVIWALHVKAEQPK
jgi:hypothetical protein